MKIRTQPLLKATLLGTTILLVYYLVAGIISYQFTQNMLDTGLFDPETFENPETFDPESDDPFLLPLAGWEAVSYGWEPVSARELPIPFFITGKKH